MSDRFVAVGHLADIPPGEGREFRVGTRHIAVFHTRAGAVFATQASCPHRGGPLRDGLIDEATVICPLHDRHYEFRTGRGLGTDCSIAVYPTQLAADGRVLVDPTPIGAALERRQVAAG